MRKTKNLALRKKRRRGKNKIEAQKELEKEKILLSFYRIKKVLPWQDFNPSI